MLMIRGECGVNIDVIPLLARNLFAAMYGGVYKRGGPSYDDLSPDQMQYLKSFVAKRAPRRMSYRGWSGLKDPYDPRSAS